MAYLESNFNEDSSFTLSEFLSEIKKTIDRKFKSGGYWVRGELSDWRKSWHHFYGELIEYDENTKQAIAKIRLNLWSSIAEKVIPKFFHETGDELKSGLKVLLFVEVSFHKNYGLSLMILDIDPSFTLGDRQARKKQIIQSLTDQKIIEHNKLLKKPSEFTSVAVISSENAAGLGDFFKEANLLSKHKLCQFDIYPASMQGKNSANEITKQFRRIYRKVKNKDIYYDVVVLIRGGGSEADLDWFNDMLPAKAICSIDLPVFTGIGHQRDQTILDLLANRSFDTPSKVIHHIINTIISNAQKAKESYEKIDIVTRYHLKNVTKNINQLKQNITNNIYLILEKKNELISIYYKQIINQAKFEIKFSQKSLYYFHEKNIKLSKDILFKNTQDINHQIKFIHRQATAQINYQKMILNKEIKSIQFSITHTYTLFNQRIKNYYQSILSLSIAPTLSRGFALTKNNNHYITSKKQAKTCQLLTIQYHDGEITTEVNDD